MRKIIKSWYKFLLILGFFRLCINLIYLSIPVFMMIVYDRVLFSFSEPSLYTMGAGVLISLLFMTIINYFHMRLHKQVGNNLVQEMMPFVLRSMQEDRTNTDYQNYTRGLYDLEFLRNAIVQGQILYVLDLPWVIIYLGLLYIMHPVIGVVALSIVAIVSVFQILLWVLQKNRQVVAETAFQANTEFIQTTIAHSELVFGMGMLSAIIEKFKDGNKKVLILRSETDAFQSGIGAIVQLFYWAGLAGIFWAGAFAFFSHKITAGAIFASAIIIARLFTPFERNLFDMKLSIEFIAAYRRLKHFVDMKVQKKKLSLPEPEGKFEAEAISLAIKGKAILHNISFALNPGESLGVFGPSSAGKTSLCKALLGIWPLAAGKVRLDGAELAQWPEDEFGRYVGYLPQETELFPATIAENISRLQVADSEKVVKAAKKAGVHDMILKLPQGYDTKIDFTGRNLAAGQRQLISLARILYGDPKLVVMDEPHTHLDDAGLRMMFHTLNYLKQAKITTVMITDRPNLLLTMDKILIIKDGQVAMYGPGKEVLNQLASRQQSQQATGV